MGGGTYTPNQGLTPQGQQLASGQPNATNIQAPPPGSPASAFPSDQNLNSAYTAANANNVNANLGSTREGYVNNAGIPGMQNNYDQLAQKLFEYDNAVLSPKFAGSNPGTPGDAAAFGRVEASPLALTPGGLNNPVNQVLSAFTSNPKFAYAAQSDQANGLLDILDVLNSGMGERLTGAKSLNAKNVDAALAALTGITGIMKLKQDAIDKANAAGKDSPGSRENTSAAYQAVVDSLRKQFGNTLNENQVYRYLQQNKATLKAAGYDVDLMFKLQHEQALAAGGKGALLDGSGKTAAQVKADQADQIKIAALKGFGSVMDAWDKDSVDIGGNGFLVPGKSDYSSQKDIYVLQLKAALKASKSQKTSETILANLPGHGIISPDVEGSFQGHLQQLLEANQLRMVKDNKTGAVSVVDQSSLNKGKEKEIKAADLTLDQIKTLLNSL